MPDHSNCASFKANTSVYNFKFYDITEEVMLAEENKSSGRSPLDGEFTHLWIITPTSYTWICDDSILYNGPKI